MEPGAGDRKHQGPPDLSLVAWRVESGWPLAGHPWCGELKATIWIRKVKKKKKKNLVLLKMICVFSLWLSPFWRICVYFSRFFKQIQEID